MSEKFYHYSYTVQEFGETIEGDTCYGSDLDEETIAAFMRGDVADTFPDGKILSFELTAVTDENGKRC